MINVIGLGLSKGDLTLSGVEAVKRAKYAVFKTDRTETYAAKEYVTGESETLDSYYETSDDFDEMNDRIVDRLVYLHEKYKDIAYLVGGSGFDDRTVLLLKERGEDFVRYFRAQRLSGGVRDVQGWREGQVRSRDGGSV